MKIKEESIQELIAQIDELIEKIQLAESEERELLEKVDETYQNSALNLIHYSAFRKSDLRNLQKELELLGLGRLSYAQEHIMASLLQTRFILHKLIDKQDSSTVTAPLSIKKSNKLLTRNTKELFGKRSKKRRVRIMVTLPTEASKDYEMVYQMVENGMDCARINCAHDSEEVWYEMIQKVNTAADELGKKVKIAMDLAGPKIRTGAIKEGPQIKKFSPKRDINGDILNPATFIFSSNPSDRFEPRTLIINAKKLNMLAVGDDLRFRDCRNKKRLLKITKISEGKVFASCYRTSYIASGTLLESDNKEIGSIKVKELPSVEQFILLRTGDLLKVTQKEEAGSSAIYNEEGVLIEPAQISCQSEEVFSKVKVGKKVLFDDGKIEGSVEKVEKDCFHVRINRAAESGAKLKAEKGINFPDSDLGIGGLTSEDKKNLAFVVKHADIINFSFVNSREDVNDLLEELERLEAINTIAIVLKIETRFAFNNILDILLEAMRVKSIGVMIARGDLAVETGWDMIGKLQEEILAICSAAHIPVVWATQVLENMAKSGLPSRSEITDATASLQAECVMLNKGIYINQALSLLDSILSDMERFRKKNRTMLPKMAKYWGSIHH